MHTSPSHPGWLVDTAGPPTRAPVARDTWSTPQTLGPMVRVARHSWSTLRAIGIERNSPGTACRHCETTDTSTSHTGHQVNTADLRAGARDALSELVDPRALRQRPVTWDSWSTACARGHKREWPKTAVQHLGPSDPGQSYPGHLVEPAGPKAWAQVTLGSWSNRRPSGSRPIHPGQLVDSVGPRIWARITREGWSNTRVAQDSRWTPRALGPKHDSPENAGPHRGPLYPVPRCLGQLVGPVGHRTWASVVRRVSRH